MQVLITTATASTASVTPIYLPFNIAPLPFGDPWSDVTMTAATPSVITVPGFNPVQNGLVTFSVGGGATLGTFSTGSVQSGVNYYTTSISGQTFSVSTQSNGPAMTAYTTGLQAGTSSLITLHTLSAQQDGPLVPFKSGGTALAIASGAVLGTGAGNAAITLMGAADKASTVSTAAYGTVLGPNVWSVIATVGVGVPKLVTLSNDWICAVGSTGTLALIQN
jgi:hypothetical protein